MLSLSRLASRAPLLARSPPLGAAGAARQKWTNSTFRPPPPPSPPPASDEKLVVLFPRQGSRMTSIEVKKRVIRSTPHMGGTRLKNMVREHARKGNMNSFIADLESRLDRFLYRCNVVPSIFAARMACGHRHVLVNGQICNSTHRILEPGDVVEPRPQSLHIFKRMMRRRLANNTFVFAKDTAPSPAKLAKLPPQPVAKVTDLEQLLKDGAEVVASYRRLPLPKKGSSSGSSSSSAVASDRLADAEATRQAQLNAIVPALVAGLAGEGTHLSGEISRRRGEIRAVAPPQMPGQKAAPPVDLAWRPADATSAKALLTIDRAALRRTLLGLLALRPE